MNPDTGYHLEIPITIPVGYKIVQISRTFVTTGGITVTNSYFNTNTTVSVDIYNCASVARSNVTCYVSILYVRN